MNIFQLYDNSYDYNDTNVYGKLNADIDWSIFAQVAEGKAEYKPLELRFKNNKILKKDFATCPGCCGIISKKGLEIVGLEAFRDFIMFLVKVNDSPYFALYSTKSIDCIDTNNSQYTDLLATHGFWEIKKHAFHLDKIKRNTVFTIPQTGVFLYCTEDIGRRILENELNFNALPLLHVEEDLRKRVFYDNPIWGISFEEPKDWVLECPQYEALKTGKKISAKAWGKGVAKNETEHLLFNMRRFELLKSNDWRQKSEIYVQVSNRKAEDIFKERSCVKTIEFEHLDLNFEAQINEYQWERTLIAPFRDELNVVIVVINRNEDVRFVGEALDVVKQIRFITF